MGSVSKKGCCWGNAVAESSFGSLKPECVHWNNYVTSHDAVQDIELYNDMVQQHST